MRRQGACSAGHSVNAIYCRRGRHPYWKLSDNTRQKPKERLRDDKGFGAYCFAGIKIMSLYNIRMRASKNKEHISGAERIVSAKDINKTVSKLLDRALSHEI